MEKKEELFFSSENFSDVLIKMSYMTMDAKDLYRIALDYDNSKYYYAYITTNLKYAAIGYSYLSADGDYKDIYINVEKVKKIMLSKENKGIYSSLEKEVNEYFKDKKVTIIAPKQVTDQGLEMFLLVMSFFMCVMNLLFTKKRILERHVHPFYRDKFRDVLSFIKDMIKNKDPKIEAYYKLFKQSINTSDDLGLGLIYGQKISPIKVKEINNFKNPSYQLWRELLVNKHIILLSLNDMMRGMCALRYYYFIQEDFSIYNNYLIFNKVFKEQDRKPLENDIVLLSDTLNSEKFSSETAKEKEPPKNQWVDVHLVQIFNNVGTTYYSKMLTALKGSDSPFTPVLYDYKQFKKYIFEFIWNFMCINKLGVVHGDCHLNNVTIQTHYPIKDEMDRFVKYTVGDETYIFMYKGIGTLIDFSRCWFFEENEIEENVKLSSPFQIDNIVNKYYGFFPEFIEKYDKKLRNALIDKHDEVLKMISVLDAYSITNATHILLKTSYASFKEGDKNYNVIQPIDKQINFIKKVNVTIRNILTTEIGLYLDGKMSAKDIGYPLQRVLQISFRKNLMDPAKDYSKYFIIDHMTYKDKFKYRLSDMYKYGIERKIIDDKQFRADYKMRMMNFNKYVKNMTIVAEN